MLSRAAGATPIARRAATAGLRLRLAVGLAGLAVLALGVVDARAEIVHFKTGRTMSVRSCQVDGDRATLALRGGGEVSMAADLIDRVVPDEVPYPEPAGSRESGVGSLGTGTGSRKTGDGGLRSGAGSRESGVGLASDAVLAARPYAKLIAETASAYQVDPRLVHAVIEVESNYQARARSPKGAKGLMQLMPATARQYAVRNPYDPKTNLEAGVRHLKDLMGRLDLSLALAAYNAGEATVKRYGGLPPFPETQSYVRRILQKVGR